MGILDKIVGWIAEQVMNLLDMISTSVLGALGCNMDSFLRYFPAAETMYSVFVALAIGLILLNGVWNIFKNFGLVAGLEAEDPIKLSMRGNRAVQLYAYYEAVGIDRVQGGVVYVRKPFSDAHSCPLRCRLL